MNYQQLIAQAIEETGVTGASFAYWDGEELHAAVAGLRNSVTVDPVTADTVMHIGSITKVFNAVLVMQLVDDGLIELDRPVLEYLPELHIRDSSALAQITCRMLLNHTNGIDGIFIPDCGPDQERIVDAITRFADLEQLHPPGAGPSYCNAGTVIAGYLTEKLREKSWYTLVRERIFEPLGMAHALADLTDLPRFRCSVGDVTDAESGQRVQTTRPFLPLSFAPAGATLMMTATDLVRFARAAISTTGNTILSAESVAQMQKENASIIEPPLWKWGLGWMLLPGGYLMHSGGGPGVHSMLFAHPESGQVLAVLTNCDEGRLAVDFILKGMGGKWAGLASENPKPAESCSPNVDSELYEGVYENMALRAEIVGLGNGIGLDLRIKSLIYDNSAIEKRSPISMIPLGDDRFRLSENSAIGNYVSFRSPGSSGRMSEMAMRLHLLRRAK